MFKRLSHAHSLTLAIWFLFRNMKTSTEFSYLKPHWFSLRLQICKTCLCDLRSCYLHSQGPGCCQQELECVCYSGSTWSQTGNCRDKLLTTLTSHPILTTRSPAIPVSSRLPPYCRKTDTQNPPEALYMDHKTLKCWDVALTWEKQAQIWLATNKSPFPSIFVDVNSCPIPPPDLKPIRNHYILKKKKKKRQAKWD